MAKTIDQNLDDKIWPAISDAGVLLRPIGDADADAYIALANNNVDFLGPWVRAPSDPAAWSSFRSRSQNPDCLFLAVCLASTDDLIGNINFSQIVYGNFCSAYVGFWIAKSYSGRGLMSAALRLAVTVAFRDLGLHRLEANIQPANERSRRLVEGVGFRLEGYSPRYLFIQDAWTDHERWAICAEDIARAAG